MPLQLETDPTPLALDTDGNVRVGGTRITIDSVVWLYKQGYGPEAVAEAYPSVSLPDIYSVIAYYLRHKESVDRYLATRQIEAEALRNKVEREFGKGPTRAELLTRWARKYGGDGCSGS
jgi:uncharacterized protein (DUF433 family)